jgi:hypothetical protein
MRALCVIAVLLIAGDAAAYEQCVSPGGTFEAYTTPNTQDGTGMKLFVRRAKTRETGMLILENMRWIDAKWSPDSQFLAVIDHSDGHIADVYVFGVRAADAAQPQLTLYYRTPEPRTYDVRWNVVGWRVGRREVILVQEVRDQNARTTKQHKIIAHIGNRSLKFPNPQ